MAAKYTHDVVATNGSYKDNQGNEKKRYVNVGKAFTNEHGQISIKLETIPVGPDWSGWVSLYEPKPRDGQQAQPRQSQHNESKANAYQPQAQDDDFERIPF